MIHSKFLIECAISLISSLSGDFCGHHNQLFFSRADYHIVHSFPTLHSDITEVSLASQTDYQKLSVFHTGPLKKYMWIAIIFVNNSFYLCGYNVIVQHSRKKKEEKKRGGGGGGAKRKGVVYWVLPNLF